MKIAIIGPGAMGLLFGGYLSQKHDVTLIGRNLQVMERIARQGILIREADGEERRYYPHAVTDSSGLHNIELMIMFVKAGASAEALEAHKKLIGKDTFLMTLQNGMGHDKLLKQYAREDHVIIGTTRQGSYRLDETSVCHSGKGETAIGMTVTADADEADQDISVSDHDLNAVRDAFAESGFPCEIAEKVQGMIWDKLMINASSSVLSGILQTAQGYVAENENAWQVARKLIEELCQVATADGYPFDSKEQIARIKTHLNNAPGGYTSIYADLKNGKKTEVSVINGAVVEAGHRLGIPVPTHEMVTDLVHAMEERGH